MERIDGFRARIDILDYCLEAADDHTGEAGVRSLYEPRHLVGLFPRVPCELLY